jgi:mannose-1-phosphate guanylyltransferase
MKIVISAGGVGTRMWPLSRENSPKQFDKIFNGKSTLQLAYDRVAPVFGAKNIFIQTMPAYQKMIRKQLPGLPKANIFLEPARRDNGPAVCFAVNQLVKLGHSGPMAIVWADHLMDRVGEFTKALKAGEKLIEQEANRFVFIAERPRFANNNLGWMKVGAQKGEIGKRDFFGFEGWKYKPEKSLCDQMFKSGEYYWNPGYFITSVEFLHDCYKKLAPEIHKCVTKGKYETCQKLSFDNAIIEKVDLSGAVILKTNMGWSDPGTLYALKEALEKSSDSNVVKGNVVDFETTDSLVYNFEPGKVVTTVGLKGMVVVNTKDAIVVVHKDDVVRISNLVKEMKVRKLEKYL